MFSFTDHPSRVCMTFITHCRLSLYLSALFLKASCQAFVHAFFPFYFASSSTLNCQHIHKLIESSGCKGKKKN
jgi:hypothetical protein